MSKHCIVTLMFSAFRDLIKTLMHDHLSDGCVTITEVVMHQHAAYRHIN